MQPGGKGPSGLLWLSVAVVLLTAFISYTGLFVPSTYAREAPLWAAEGFGGDAVNLGLIVPVLLASAVMTHRGSVPARLVWMGTMLFLVYNFSIYSLAVHFNALFLAYCGVLGLSFYGFLMGFASVSPEAIADRYGRDAPVRAMAAGFFLVAAVFAAQWLREIVPAILSGTTPKSVTDAGLLTNPVYVLDLALALPAFVITGVMLLRRRPLAFVLAPVLMAFGILMTLAVAGMMASMAVRGFANDITVAVFFAATAFLWTTLLALYFRGGRRKPS